jgi:siroheme decarboxylase
MPERAATLDDMDRRLINALQGGFPLCEEPYRAVAESLGLTESELLSRLERMLAQGVLSRFGPLYQIERMGGSFVLAALAVADEDFERVAEIVNAFSEVAHNYRRDHRLNMWFVLATETPEGIGQVIARIEAQTGLTVFAFPKEREYFVGMRLAA